MTKAKRWEIEGENPDSRQLRVEIGDGGTFLPGQYSKPKHTWEEDRECSA